jgi:hypothetical protein
MKTLQENKRMKPVKDVLLSNLQPYGPNLELPLHPPRKDTANSDKRRECYTKTCWKNTKYEFV